MNDLLVFKCDDFGQVRSVMQNGEPWFVAADVCKSLEIRNPTDALRRLDDDEKALVSIEGLSRGNSKGNIINEPGLYTLVLGSRKPQAKAFRRWITHDVIPAIRKTGAYIAGEETMSDEELLSRALTIAEQKIRLREDEIRYLQLDNVSLEYENRFLRPKAAYFDTAMNMSQLTGIRETALLLGTTQSVIVDVILRTGLAYRNKQNKLMPYQQKNKGYFTLKETSNSGNGWSGVQFMVTPKGRAHLHSIL